MLKAFNALNIWRIELPALIRLLVKKYNFTISAVYELVTSLRIDYQPWDSV